MAPLWQQLRVGDKIRLIEMPPEFGDESLLHRDTRRAYQRLLERRRPLRVCKVAHGGPWVRFKFRRKNGKWEHHWMLFNHGGIVRVKSRSAPRGR